MAGCCRALLAAAFVDLVGENNHMDRVTNYLRELLNTMDAMMRSYKDILPKILNVTYLLLTQILIETLVTFSNPYNHSRVS